MGCNSSKASNTATSLQAKPQEPVPPKTLLNDSLMSRSQSLDKDAVVTQTPDIGQEAISSKAANTHKDSVELISDGVAQVPGTVETVRSFSEQMIPKDSDKSPHLSAGSEVNQVNTVQPQRGSRFQWPEWTGPSSRIIKTPEDWCDRGILVPHEAFRWLHNGIRRALEHFDPLEPGQDWKTAVFFNWLERYYVTAIHHHHEAEENIYNPAIIEKGGNLPAKITADHKDIIEGLDRIGSFRARVEAGDEAAIAEFKAHLTNLIDTIEDHLAEEEEAYPEALRSSGMTEAEERVVVDKIIQSLGLDGNKVFLPPIVYAMHMWAGREIADTFVNGLPPPIRLAFNRCWLADFRANNLAVIVALQGSEEFVPNQPGCDLCNVM